MRLRLPDSASCCSALLIRRIRCGIEALYSRRFLVPPRTLQLSSHGAEIHHHPTYG